jgi:hypothetical protein
MNEAMTHERCSELLPGILRGDLTSEDEAAARAHLAGCEECQAELSGLNALQGEELLQMSSEERDRLHRGVAAALAPAGRAADVIPLEGRRVAPRGARWLGAAAAVIVLGVGAAFATQLFAGGDDGDAGVESADSGAGGAGTESVQDLDGPRPVFAGSALALSDAPEPAAEESAAGEDEGAARTANQFSSAIDSAERLRRLARGSPLLAAFADAYDAAEAEALADDFLGLLVEDAGNVPAAAQVEECGQIALDAAIDPILPVFAAPSRYEGEPSLVLGYVTGDSSLDHYSVWVWPEGSCDRPLHTDGGDLSS